MPRGVSHGADFWRNHEAAHKASGLTLGQYCEKHGLNKKTFSGWRRRLKRGLKNAAGGNRRSSKAAESFLRVDVAGEKLPTEAPLASSQARTRSGVTLQLSGWQVHLDVGFDASTLRALIQELRQP